MAFTGMVYDPDTGKWTARKLGAGEIASGALEAYHINTVDASKLTTGLLNMDRISGALVGSGQIMAYHISTVDAAKLTTGLLAHARVSGLPYAKLALSGQILDTDIGSGQIEAYNINTVDASKLITGILNELRISGYQDARHLTTGLLAHARVSGLPYSNLALSGQILDTDIGSGQIEAYNINTVDAVKLTTGLLAHARVSGLPYANLALSGKVVYADLYISGKITSYDIASGMLSGYIAYRDLNVSGQLLYTDLLVSGKIKESDLVSGIAIDISETVKEPTYTAGEVIGAYYAVYLITGQHVGIALADDADKMPAFGMLGPTSVVTGAVAQIHIEGRAPANPAFLSGLYQNIVFVQADGTVRTSAPSATSNIQQRMGVVSNPDEIQLYPSPIAVTIA